MGKASAVPTHKGSAGIIYVVGKMEGEHTRSSEGVLYQPRTVVAGAFRGCVATKFRGSRDSEEPPNHFARIADSERIRRQIAHDNSTCADDSVVADAHTRADHARSTEPDIMANGYRFRGFKPTA